MYYNSKYARRAAALGRIPKTYYSHGSPWLGEMVVLMENLQAGSGVNRVGVNQLMGNQIWGVAENTPKNVNKLELLKAMYYLAAEVHAQFWMDDSLLKERWMRNTNWFHSGDRHHWEWTMKTARQGSKFELVRNLSTPTISWKFWMPPLPIRVGFNCKNTSRRLPSLWRMVTSMLPT